MLQISRNYIHPVLVCVVTTKCVSNLSCYNIIINLLACRGVACVFDRAAASSLPPAQSVQLWAEFIKAVFCWVTF